MNNVKDFQIIPKPDWLKWSEICNFLHRAHLSNQQYGFVMKTAFVDEKTVQKKLYKGKCFVALDDGKLIATASLAIDTGNHWYDKNKMVSFWVYDAVDPDYQGLGIIKMLNIERERYSKEMGAIIIRSGTSIANERQLSIFKKQGFKKVDYLTSKDSSYYSIIVAKWLGECPFSDKYCTRRFLWAKFWTRLRFKPGKIERFKIIGFTSRAFNKLKSLTKKWGKQF